MINSGYYNPKIDIAIQICSSLGVCRAQVQHNHHPLCSNPTLIFLGLSFISTAASQFRCQIAAVT